MTVSADLVIPASDGAALQEIASWDGVRPATLAAAEFPVDVVRLERSSSPPLVISRARRAEGLKALPASLRARAQEAFDRAGRKPASLALARGGSLDLGGAPAVMGILNVTPDSFSDGGLHFGAARAVSARSRCSEKGRDRGRRGRIDPARSYGAAPGPGRGEIRRVVRSSRRSFEDRAALSIDTRKAAVARAAIAAGADLVNDVSAFRFDPDMAGVVAETGAAAILMHMKGSDPRTMQADVPTPIRSPRSPRSSPPP